MLKITDKFFTDAIFMTAAKTEKLRLANIPEAKDLFKLIIFDLSDVENPHNATLKVIVAGETISMHETPVNLGTGKLPDMHRTAFFLRWLSADFDFSCFFEAADRLNEQGYPSEDIDSFEVIIKLEIAPST